MILGRSDTVGGEQTFAGVPLSTDWCLSRVQSHVALQVQGRSQSRGCSAGEEVWCRQIRGRLRNIWFLDSYSRYSFHPKEYSHIIISLELVFCAFISYCQPVVFALVGISLDPFSISNKTILQSVEAAIFSLELFDRYEIWQAPRQQCQISK